MKKFLTILLIVLVSGCTNPTGQVTKIPEIREDGKIEIYFCPQDECREKLVNFLNGAEKSIHCAFFDVDLQEVKNELKHEIDVKLVTDVKNINKSKELNPIVNPGYQLMHNKFCIVDGKKIFTGSFNPTENCNFYNNNNILIIESDHIAKNYEDEFVELFGETFAGGNEVKYPIVYLKDSKIENYFCPEDDCSSHVLDTLENARKEIYFMTFSFTDDDIGNMLIRNYDDAIIVKGVFERSGMSDYSEYQRLLNAGMDVKLDNNNHKLHHKVFIIDNETVVTGSYNPSSSGDDKNDENILIIHDKNVAKNFLEEFERVWNYEEIIVTVCMPRQDVVISEIYYDTTGKDSEEEYVSIYNPSSSNVNLDYYFLSRDKNNQRLSGIISPGGTKKFNPKFSLPNSGGYVVLSKGGYQVDYVNWENNWKIEAKKGEILSRKSFERANCEEEWEV